MPNFCPCKRCRPPGQSFFVAMEVAIREGRRKHWSPERIAEEEAAKKKRIAALRKLDQIDE